MPRVTPPLRRHRPTRRALGLVLAALLLAAGCSATESTDDAGPDLRAERPTTSSAAPSSTQAPPSSSSTDPGAAADADAESTTSTTVADVPTVIEPLVGHYEPRVLARHPHDVAVFTQGLEFFDGALLESGGGWGESSLRLFDYDAGDDRWRLDLAEDDLFAEGVTVVDGRALQLTWKSETLLVTDLAGLADRDGDGQATPADPERRLGSYQGEGWGLCFDGGRLIMSNGSSRLTFRDPATFAATGEVEVTLQGRSIESLNELECVGSQVMANIWQSDTIVVIDPATGNVDATIDASSLVPEGYTETNSEVLNGIARHPERGTLWLTGKRWPVLYEVELVPA